MQYTLAPRFAVTRFFNMSLPDYQGCAWINNAEGDYWYLAGVVDMAGKGESPQPTLIACRWESPATTPCVVEVVHTTDLPMSIANRFKRLDGLRNVASLSQAAEVFEALGILVPFYPPSADAGSAEATPLAVA